MLKLLIAVPVVLALLWATWKKPRLTGSIVWSLLATILGSAGAFLLLPTPVKPTLLWYSLMTPLVWVACIFWCQWDSRPLRPAAGLIAISIAGTLGVVFLPGPAGG